MAKKASSQIHYQKTTPVVGIGLLSLVAISVRVALNIPVSRGLI